MEQMTPEQAIRVIKIIKSKYDGLKSYKDCFNALKMAISAFEKQLPKKPIRMMNRTYPDYSWYENCPNCSKHLGDEKFCTDCGQAIDWSE